MKIKKSLYYLEGDNYNKAMKLMNNNGYNTGIFIPRKIKENESLVLHIDHEEKIVKLFPLEVYAPESPLKDEKKYNEILDTCRDFVQLKQDIKESD